MEAVRVLLTGAGGQLAVELARAFAAPAYKVLALDRRALDITDAHAVDTAVAVHRPAIILNAAAYNRVDAAESEPEATFAANAFSPRILARAARWQGSTVVHYSTSYVFDGGAGWPYTEESLPRPLGVYGVAKLAGEQFVAAGAPRAYIPRVSAVFGAAGQATRHGNFVERMLGLAAAGRPLRVVADQAVCPTYAPDIARVTRDLLEQGHAPGLYHCVGSANCSWYAVCPGNLRGGRSYARARADHGGGVRRPCPASLLRRVG